MFGCGIIGEVIAFAHLVLRILADFVSLTALSIRTRRSIEEENLAHWDRVAGDLGSRC